MTAQGSHKQAFVARILFYTCGLGQLIACAYGVQQPHCLTALLSHPKTGTPGDFLFQKFYLNKHKRALERGKRKRWSTPLKHEIKGPMTQWLLLMSSPFIYINKININRQSIGPRRPSITSVYLLPNMWVPVNCYVGIHQNAHRSPSILVRLPFSSHCPASLKAGLLERFSGVNPMQIYGKNKVQLGKIQACHSTCLKQDILALCHFP